MSRTLHFKLVDAFGNAPLTGNPAGVVLDADDLEPAQMQAIAREVNASETAFVFGTHDLHRGLRIRWFAPGAEVDFCGHATLAAAHALHESGVLRRKPGEPEGSVTFEAKCGPLRLHAERTQRDTALLWWLQMPTPVLKPDNTNPMRTCELLGLALDDLDSGIPPMRTGDNDLILMVRSWQRLYEARPAFDELARWSERHNIRGFCLATTNTLDDSTQVASRFFAPAVGINEDPVTGSVHGPLCALLVANEQVPLADGKAALQCIQSQAGGRSGLVRALVERVEHGWRVAIAGRCFTTIRGDLLL